MKFVLVLLLLLGLLPQSLSGQTDQQKLQAYFERFAATDSVLYSPADEELLHSIATSDIRPFLDIFEGALRNGSRLMRIRACQLIDLAVLGFPTNAASIQQLEPLLEALAFDRNEDVGIRQAALEIIGYIPGKPAVTMEHLLQSAQDNNPKVRLSALTGLARRYGGTTPEVREVLVGSLKSDTDDSVRTAAAALLGSVNTDETEFILVVVALSNALSDPSPQVQQAAIQSLAKFGPMAELALPRLRQSLEYVELLRKLLQDAINRIEGR